MVNAARATKRLMTQMGLVHAPQSSLKITRKRHGKLFAFYTADGTLIRDEATRARLRALAVPPAYVEVRYARSPKAHLQAIGKDTAGRLQYRYHPDWEKVRENLKAARLAEMVAGLPRIRRALGRDLAITEPSKTFALAACVELVSHTAIRAGGERHEAVTGSRGATTLLKSNVRCVDGALAISFRGKGGKQISKAATATRLCRAIDRLRQIPGKRLFQYRGADGLVHALKASDVNTYLKEISGCAISLKDFRTLLASSMVADTLASLEPAPSVSGRKRQVKAAVESAAEELANTPTVCRKSYVHESVIDAFETGKLKRLKARKAPAKSVSAKLDLLAAVVGKAA